MVRDPVRAYYEALAAKREPGPLVETSRHWYALAAIGSGRRVLDVGCGNGLLLQHLASRFDERVGVDFALSEHALSLRAEGIEMICADVAQGLPFDAGQFDAVASLDVLEHVFDPLTFLRELRRVLRPGGRLVITTPNVRYVRQLWRIAVQGLGPQTSSEVGGWDGGHLHYFTRRDLEELFRDAGFHAIRVEGVINALGRGVELKRKLVPLRNVSVVREFLAVAQLVTAVA